MSQVRDLYEMIQDVVREETIYLKHYIGQVTNNVDVSKKGRVQITIPELGLDNPALGLWAFPRQGHGMSVPAIGEYAEIYFINGDRMKPVYLYPASEIIDNIPTEYKGIPDTHILFESPKFKDYIKYDDLIGELELKGSTFLTLNTGDASGWLPNILATDPFTGVPHGGATAGIVKLRGK